MIPMAVENGRRPKTYSKAQLDPQMNAPVANNFIFTIPDGVRWKLQNIQFRLVTDATAGNRTVYFYIEDENGNQLYYLGAGTQAPSTTWRYNLGDWPNSFSDNITRMVPVPQNLVLEAGWKIKCEAFGYGPADQWSINAQGGAVVYEFKP